MSQDECTDIKECPQCEKAQPEGPMIINTDIVLQGTIPLIVRYYRCPLCGHEWDEALEPAHRTSLEGEASRTMTDQRLAALMEFPLRLVQQRGLSGPDHQILEIGDVVLIEQWLVEEGYSARECRVISLKGKRIEVEEITAHFPNSDGSVRTVAGDGRRLTCRASSFETPFEKRFLGMVAVMTTMLEYYPQQD